MIQYSLMQEPTELSSLLEQLSRSARAAGLTDTGWASRAGVRKETLSRLRGRITCDFATLSALAAVVNSKLTLLGEMPVAVAADGHFPAGISRDYEQRLIELCASRSLQPDRWLALGPRFFMAGLAVMMASVTGHDRRGLLALAEQLHPGVSEPNVFARWLQSSPLRPSRFLPMLTAGNNRAA
jgi:hypothetical protein